MAMQVPLADVHGAGRAMLRRIAQDVETRRRARLAGAAGNGDVVTAQDPAL
ncbi:hypothetical protein CBM2633_B10062 [Cupriavidus taiwanensis]|nr:hypothetical protein CBM2633_B10062 [Cupriavidus taiwanensis]